MFSDRENFFYMVYFPFCSYPGGEAIDVSGFPADSASRRTDVVAPTVLFFHLRKSLLSLYFIGRAGLRTTITSKSMASMHKLDDRITPHKNKHDVYFGRGGLGNMLRRYSMYRDLIAKNFESYRDSVTRFHQKRDFAQRRVVDEILRAGGKFFNEERTTDDGSKMEFKELNPEDKDDATLIVTKIMQAFRDMGRKGDRPDCCSRVFSQNCNNNRVREKSMKKNKFKMKISFLESLCTMQRKRSNKKFLPNAC